MRSVGAGGRSKTGALYAVPPTVPAAAAPLSSAGPDSAPADARAAVDFIRAVARHPTCGFESSKRLKDRVMTIRQELFTTATAVSGHPRKKKLKLMPDTRMCSPMLFPPEQPRRPSLLFVTKRSSHAAPPDPAASAASMLEIAARQRVCIATPPTTQHLDQYLALVGDIYYKGSEAPPTSQDQDFGLIRRTTLGKLVAEPRRPDILDRWSPYEVALFESGICLFGKMFSQLHAVIKTKSVQEIVEFFYVWKMSKNYKRWKETFSLTAQQ